MKKNITLIIILILALSAISIASAQINPKPQLLEIQQEGKIESANLRTRMINVDQENITQNITTTKIATKTNIRKAQNKIMNKIKESISDKDINRIKNAIGSTSENIKHFIENLPEEKQIVFAYMNQTSQKKPIQFRNRKCHKTN